MATVVGSVPAVVCVRVEWDIVSCCGYLKAC